MDINFFPDKIEIEDKINRKIINSLPSPVIYCPSVYKVDNQCTGKGVKIAILDSGCPQHNDIKITGDKISLCEENLNVYDKIGHATAISGIINANNKKGIVGLAPNAQLYFAKIVDNNGICSFNALVAGVLWAIVKQVDIIVIAMGSKYDYMVLKDAIKKARDHDICVFAASGDNITENSDIDFPARYENVFSSGFLTRSKKRNILIKSKVNFVLPNKALFTTYLNNQYIKLTGSSIATSFFAGIAATFIEQYKKGRKKDISSLVYSSMSKIFK